MISPRVVSTAAFVATFLAGAAMMRLIDVRSASAAQGESGASWPATAAALGLTPDQHRKADSIFTHYQPSTDAVLTSLIPRLTAVSDSMHTDIEALLSADQRARLREIQRPATFLLRRKTPEGSRVDTLHVPRGR